MPHDGLLSGLTILDLTIGAAGPFATRFFAGFGARVIKVERPGRGDPARRNGPFSDARPDAGPLFLYLNTGKESVTIDLAAASGRRLVLDLAEHADALVESIPPGALDAAGLGLEALHGRNPRLLVTSVSAFGRTGPYASWRPADLTAFAAGGQMSLLGEPAHEPLVAAGHQAAYQAGLHAFGATLAALYSVGVIEAGQQIDISAMECMASSLELYLPDFLYRKTTVLSKRRGNIAAATLGIFPAVDGHAGVHVMARNWPAFARVLGDESLATDERFCDQRARLEHNDELLARVLAWTASHTRDEIYRRAGDERCTLAPVLELPQVLAEPHLRARAAFDDVEGLPHPSAPFRSDAGGWELRPAPRLGEHNETVLCDTLGLSRREVVRLRAAGVV